MNKKVLTAALVSSLAVVQLASAQEFDDRWYLTGSVGYNFQNHKRLTKDAPFFTLGLGKFVSPNWSVDTELNYQNPHFKKNKNLNWSQYGISFDARRFFINEERSWNPYLLMGIGYQRSEEEYIQPGSVVSPLERKNGTFAAKVGAGLQTTFSHRVALRAEIAYRADIDKHSKRMPEGIAPTSDPKWFGDALASVGIVVPLGPAPSAPPPPPPPAAPSCADLDDDGDGVNNCDDKCPNSQPGQTVGPDGCPVPVSIDLKGVNFAFNRANLSAESRSILDQAVEILKKYPDLRVEVAGNTDSIGKPAYNQKLSERRAKVVYDYLVSHGIESSRLIGPVGYGATHPIAPNKLPNGKDNPAGRAKNRRTELNVQN